MVRFPHTPVAQNEFANTIDSDCQSGVWVGSHGTRAFAAFDGATCTPYCPLRSSFNISNVLRLSAGVYQVSFVTAMPDAAYGLSWTPGSGYNGSGNTWTLDVAAVAPTYFVVHSKGINGLFFDSAFATVAVYR